MKVLFLISSNFRDSQTGAGTQVRETINALRDQGVEIERLFVSFNPTIFSDEFGQPVSFAKAVEIVNRNDVVHLIHCSRWMAEVWRTLPRKPSVGSTIYWGGWERVQMAWRNAPRSLLGLKTVLNYVRAMTPWYLDLSGVDVFLPNSSAEAENVRRYARTSPHSLMFPVNNGFIPPGFELDELPRHRDAPSGDYIVVPGIIVSRKNQLGLIKAMRSSDYEFVFMGGYDENDWFYRQCRRYSTPRMHFVGYVQHDSREYWSWLRHARCSVLPSDCETPGIAMIESCYAGARPIITRFGGTVEYYGFDAEYFDPRSSRQLRHAIDVGWRRGRLAKCEAESYSRFTWKYCAGLTRMAYELARDRVGRDRT